MPPREEGPLSLLPPLPRSSRRGLLRQVVRELELAGNGRCLSYGVSDDDTLPTASFYNIIFWQGGLKTGRF